MRNEKSTGPSAPTERSGSKEIPAERLARFHAARLLTGSHPSIDSGGCIMEWAAFLAGRPHSDKPPCVSGVLGAFLRPWNDALSDADRQMLKPYAPRVLGTAGTQAQEDRRSWMAIDWLIREYTPAWLDLVPSLKADADTLRALPETVDEHGISDAIAALGPIQKRSAAAGADAAWDAARAAAGADAAWDAAWAAAGADAAGAAAWADAWADAAGAAAWAAAGAALAPTVERLQKSALALLDRMIAVSGPTISSPPKAKE